LISDRRIPCRCPRPPGAHRRFVPMETNTTARDRAAIETPERRKVSEYLRARAAQRRDRTITARSCSSTSRRVGNGDGIQGVPVDQRQVTRHAAGRASMNLRTRAQAGSASRLISPMNINLFKGSSRQEGRKGDPGTSRGSHPGAGRQQPRHRATASQGEENIIRNERNGQTREQSKKHPILLKRNPPPRKSKKPPANNIWRVEQSTADRCTRELLKAQERARRTVIANSKSHATGHGRFRACSRGS